MLFLLIYYWLHPYHLGSSGVSQTAAMQTDSFKVLKITREEREDDFGCMGGRQDIAAQDRQFYWLLLCTAVRDVV